MEVAACFVVWGLAPVISVGFRSLMSRPEKKKKSIDMGQTVVFGEQRSLECTVSNEECDEIEQAVPGCEHGWFPSCYDGTQLHYRLWKPQNAPKAILIFMHGIATHGGKGFVDASTGRKLNSSLQAAECVQNNVVLAAFDLYGHGFSEGSRCWIPERWEVNRDDCIQFCKLVAKMYRNIPIFLMGESYGGTLTLHTAHHFQKNPNDLPKFDSIILAAPAIIGDVPPEPLFSILVFLAKFFPRWTPFFMPNPVSPDRIWRDPNVCAWRSQRKHRFIDGSGIPFRLGTGLQLVQAMEAVRQTVIPQLSVPFLALHGTEDAAVPMAGSELLLAEAPTTDKKLLRYKGAYHDIMADECAEECMREILSWIDERLELTAKV